MKMIGDVLTSSILFEALRNEFPGAELHYMIYKHTYPVVENNPFIDKFIIAEKDQKIFNVIRDLKKEKYHAVIDIYANLKTAIITGLSGGAYRISYDKKYTRPFCTHVFSRKIEAKTNAGAAIEKRLRLLSPLSNNFPVQIKPKIYLRDKEVEDAKIRLENEGVDVSKKLYMISALGSSGSKTYPLHYLAELLDKIVDNTNSALLLNYIPSQRSDIDKLYNYCEPKTQAKIHLDIYGKSIREFLALTSHCDGLIGNEGGAVNMAKALNIPTFAIFSPQIMKENWNMYEDGVTNISVHLKDYMPEIFQNKKHKHISKQNKEFYQQFEPSFIKTELIHFLNQHSK